MIYRGLLNHAGLAKPYRFERTLAVAFALLLALIVGAVALSFVLQHKVRPGTPLAWYFVYLAILIAAGAVCARWPRTAAVFLTLAAIEAGLGIGSALLYKYRLAPSATLLPADYDRTPYTWHPLLQAVPLPTPPDRMARARFTINSQGQRGPERPPGSLDGKAVVALFGGSTTLDFGSPQGKSWGEQLENVLGPERFAVINHGSGAYTSVEHLIQTAFYESSFGVQPRCALYYLGWNDLQNSHIRGLDPGYADFHLRTLVDTLEARRTSPLSLSLSPLLRLAGKFAMLAVDTARPAGVPAGELSAAPDANLERLYLRNVSAISAINRGRGIRTIWVGQLLNRAELTASTPYGWLPFIADKDVWPLTNRLNGLLKEQAKALADIYIDVPIDDFSAADFIDQGHFTPPGSLKFARHLAPAVSQACPAGRP